MNISAVADGFTNDDDEKSVAEAIGRMVEILRRVDPAKRTYVLRAASCRLDQPMIQTAASTVTGLLSRRENEIFTFLVNGHNNKEISVALCISIKTVETHRGNILKKLEVHSVVDLLLLAVREGILGKAVPQTA